jgi:hypothetical protein
MPRNEFDQQMQALRQPTSMPMEGAKPTPYTHSVANERLSNIAMAGSQGPFATIAFEDSGKTSNIYPGSELAGGFVVEEITPEGVVVLPETGPRQIWQRGQSQRQPSATAAPSAAQLNVDAPVEGFTQEDSDALDDMFGDLTGSEMIDRVQAFQERMDNFRHFHRLIPQDYEGYGAEHIYGTDIPEAANDMAQADLNLRINDPEKFKTTGSSAEDNWNNTEWTLHTVDGEDMTRYFLEKDDQVLNMTGHPDFKPDTE